MTVEKQPKPDNEDADYLRPGDVSASWLAGYILKKGCLTLLVILLVLIGGCIFLEPYQHHAVHARLYAKDCIGSLGHIGHILYYLARPDEEPVLLNASVIVVSADGERVSEPWSWRREGDIPPEITQDTTILDLIQESVRRGDLASERLCCPYSKRPYLVFPAPASVLLQPDDPQHRIPIVMDCPDSHMETDFRVKLFMPRDSHTGKKYHLTARVLYADGGVGTISMEEAEKLVAENSPVPLELKPETTDESGVRSGDGE